MLRALPPGLQILLAHIRRRLPKVMKCPWLSVGLVRRALAEQQDREEHLLGRARARRGRRPPIGAALVDGDERGGTEVCRRAPSGPLVPVAFAGEDGLLLWGHSSLVGTEDLCRRRPKPKPDLTEQRTPTGQEGRATIGAMRQSE